VPAAPQVDLTKVYLHFPYTGATTTENDGRLMDFLRALAASRVAPIQTGNPALILANAVSLMLGGGSTSVPWGDGTVAWPAQNPPNTALATAVAELAVTGRASFEAFANLTPQNADLVAAFNNTFPAATFTAAQISAAAGQVLDSAYTALWQIRSNDPGWRQSRTGEGVGWIAVSGFDDTPHRPVNVPTAPYPQYDLPLSVPLVAGGALSLTTRYMIASAGTFVGPNDGSSSFTARDPLLLAPRAPPPGGAAPRTIPPDNPSIPAGNKIILYVHGGGSRTEEAVDMANWFIVEGNAAGENYTVVSFDLPNSAYGESFDISKVAGTSYDHSQLKILHFEREYIIAFIEALDVKLGGGVKGQIVAVMGGSLGGNTSALLTGRYDANHAYLRTIVSWSVTAMAPDTYLGIISAGDVGEFLAGLQSQATSPERFDDHQTEAQYISDMYTKPLASILGIPPQPVMWYRGGYADGSGTWQPCKDQDIARSRFDRYEIYCPNSRHWTTAIDLEQISFSFQDEKQGLSVVTTPDSAALPGSRFMLVAGDNDNFFPNEIYNSTIDLVRAIRLSGQGKAEFYLDTGHSIHNERPHLFAKDILYFLDHLDAGDSPYGTTVATPPKAVNSVTTQ
jgi:pimeloyl-ACP methyl ester carboxylesterase